MKNRKASADYTDCTDYKFEKSAESAESADNKLDDEASADCTDCADYKFEKSAKSAESADQSIHMRDPQTYAIIGAAMTVHRTLGPGFLEAVYQEALAIELAHAGVPFEREVPLPIRYRNTVLACHYRSDFICFGSIIVELKALSQIGNTEKAQVLNYLKATGLERALLLNFGESSLRHERLIRTAQKKSSADFADPPDYSSQSAESAKSADSPKLKDPGA